MTATAIILLGALAVLANPGPAAARMWRCEHRGNRRSAGGWPEGASSL